MFCIRGDMVEENKIDRKELAVVIRKLLEKAGMDARLTPKLLRQKAEQKMKLEEFSLKVLKADILLMCDAWWRETNPPPKNDASESSSASSDALKMIMKYAKAVGKGPHFFKEFTQEIDKEKAADIRARLQKEGFTVPKVPTQEEIEVARKAFDLKKEMADIDPSLQLKGKRRGGDEGEDKPKAVEKSSTADSIDKVKKEKDSSSSSPQKDNQVFAKKMKLNPNEEEEEAEF